MLIWACTILVGLASFIGEVARFGAHAVTVPTLVGGVFGGVQLSEAAPVPRVALGTADVAFGLTALLAIGTLFSTVTDSAAGPVDATIGVYRVGDPRRDTPAR